jgi:hypothetical protein
MLILREGAYAMEQRERIAHGHERPGIAAVEPAPRRWCPEHVTRPPRKVIRLLTSHLLALLIRFSWTRRNA